MEVLIIEDFYNKEFETRCAIYYVKYNDRKYIVTRHNEQFKVIIHLSEEDVLEPITDSLKNKIIEQLKMIGKE